MLLHQSMFFDIHIFPHKSWIHLFNFCLFSISQWDLFVNVAILPTQGHNTSPITCVLQRSRFQHHSEVDLMFNILFVSIVLAADVKNDWCVTFLRACPRKKLVAARNVSVALRLHSFDSKEPSKTQDFFPHEEWLEKYNAEAFVSSFVMVQQLWLLQPCCLGGFNWLGAHPQLQFFCPWLPMTIAKSQKLPNPTLTYHSNLWTYHLPLHTPAQYVVQFQSTAHPDNDQSVSASLFHATPTNGCGWTPKKTVNEQRKTVSAPPVSFNHPQVCSCKHRLAVRCSDPRSPTFQVGLNIFLCQKIKSVVRRTTNLLQKVLLSRPKHCRMCSSRTKKVHSTLFVLIKYTLWTLGWDRCNFKWWFDHDFPLLMNFCKHWVFACASQLMRSPWLSTHASKKFTLFGSLDAEQRLCARKRLSFLWLNVLFFCHVQMCWQVLQCVTHSTFQV